MIRIYRYDGSDSTIAGGLTQQQAEYAAGLLNQDTQSEQYVAEEYDPEKAKQFWLDVDRAMEMINNERGNHGLQGK